MLTDTKAEGLEQLIPQGVPLRTPEGWSKPGYVDRALAAVRDYRFTDSIRKRGLLLVPESYGMYRVFGELIASSADALDTMIKLYERTAVLFAEAITYLPSTAIQFATNLIAGKPGPALDAFTNLHWLTNAEYSTETNILAGYAIIGVCEYLASKRPKEAFAEATGTPNPKVKKPTK
jgi:hypothetical protein